MRICRNGCNTITRNGRHYHAKVIQAVLGHARFSVTMDLYSHLMDGMHEEAAEALDSLLGAS